MIRGALTLLLLAPVSAGAFDLDFPLDCTLGETCYIQQYFDRDPGPDAADHTCGTLSYDGHDGTDIGLPTIAAMQAGVVVRAAAPGVVLGMRDGMEDIRMSDPGAPDVKGRECGNGVVIAHDGGWQTQYCHMKSGSIAVRKGDTVATGTPLGQVGLSGMTEFPHLHVSVRRDGVEIDPFDPDDTPACGTPSQPLWQVPIDYRPGGILTIGIATEVPEYEAIKQGLPQADPMPAKAPALVVWAHLFGSRAGDQLALSITGPAGEVIADSVALDRTQAQSFRAVGKRLAGPEGWPTGAYQASATLLRDGQPIDSRSLIIRIEG